MREGYFDRMREGMFSGIQGEVVFSGRDARKIRSLMAAQGRAARCAYRALRDGKTGNDVRKHLKAANHAGLGVRYMDSAISTVEGLAEKPHVLLGGRENWERLRRGEISREEWHRRRNDRLFARGDRSKKGNPLIRVENGELRVLIPSGAGVRGVWVKPRPSTSFIHSLPKRRRATAPG